MQERRQLARAAPGLPGRASVSRRQVSRTDARGRRRWPAALPTDGRWRHGPPVGRWSAPCLATASAGTTRPARPLAAVARDTPAPPAHQRNLGIEPRLEAAPRSSAASGGCGRATRLPLEVLDGVGHEDLRRSSPAAPSRARARRRPDRQTAHRRDPPGRLGCSPTASPGLRGPARHRLGGRLEQVAARADLLGGGERVERCRGALWTHRPRTARTRRAISGLGRLPARRAAGPSRRA